MEDYIRKNDKKVDHIEKVLIDHIKGMPERSKLLKEDIEKIIKTSTDDIHKILNEQNIKSVENDKKVNEMYDILMDSRKIKGGIKGMLGWLLLIAAVIAVFKGWALGLLTWLGKY